jgi:hypothetical protein
MASRQIEGYPTFLNDSAQRARQALIEVNAVRAISTVGELAPHGSNVRSGVKTAHWSTRKRRPHCAAFTGPLHLWNPRSDVHYEYLIQIIETP